MNFIFFRIPKTGSETQKGYWSSTSHVINKQNNYCVPICNRINNLDIYKTQTIRCFNLLIIKLYIIHLHVHYIENQYLNSVLIILYKQFSERKIYDLRYLKIISFFFFFLFFTKLWLSKKT